MSRHIRSISNNNHGATLVSILVLSAVIALTGTAILFSFKSRQQTQMNMQAKEDLMNLSTKLKMMFSSKEVCKMNLASNAFGTTLNQLKSRSATKDIRIVNKPIGSATPQIYLEKNKPIERLVFQGGYFDNIRPLEKYSSTNETYLADLKISTTDAFKVSLKEISFPFYITTNSAGTLTDCFATSYPVEGDTTTTLEDILCNEIRRQFDSSLTYVFSPSEHACVKVAAGAP